jgi:hypothetical protein
MEKYESMIWDDSLLAIKFIRLAEFKKEVIVCSDLNKNFTLIKGKIFEVDNKIIINHQHHFDRWSAQHEDKHFYKNIFYTKCIREISVYRNHRDNRIIKVYRNDCDYLPEEYLQKYYSDDVSKYH